MEKMEFKVEGLHCAGCVTSVTRMLTAVPGVESVEVSLGEGKVDVEYDAARAGLADFKRAVERAGFKAP